MTVQNTITIEEATERLIDYRGKTPPKTHSGIRLVTAKVVKRGEILNEPAEFISADFYDEWMRRGLPKKNDVLLTTEAPLGEVASLRTNERIALAQRIILLRAKSGTVDPIFLFYALQSDLGQSELKARASGTTVLGIKQSELRQARIPVFALERQKQIGTVLFAFDELIRNSQQRIHLLEKIARSIYDEWFVKLRLPSGQNHTLTPSILGDIPSDWEVKTLREIAEELRRGVPKGDLTKPTPFVGLEHIPRRSLALDSWDIVSELGSNKLAFQKGDILFGKIRPYFHKVSIAPFDGLCSADTIVLRARKAEYYPWLVMCISSDAFIAKASATANGAKMPRASWEVLAEHPVLIPKGKLADSFSGLLTDALAQQQTLIFQIHRLRQIRDLLLARLLSGQLYIPPDK